MARSLGRSGALRPGTRERDAVVASRLAPVRPCLTREGLGQRDARVATPSPVRSRHAWRRPLMARMRESRGPVTSCPVPVDQSASVAAEAEAGDAPLGADEQVRAAVVVGDGNQSCVVGAVLQSERHPDVAAVGHDLAEHGDRRGGRRLVVVVRARSRATRSDGSRATEAPPSRSA